MVAEKARPQGPHTEARKHGSTEERKKAGWCFATRLLSLSKHRVSLQQRRRKNFFTFFAQNLDKTFPVRYGE
jgi:hypothetical protein